MAFKNVEPIIAKVTTKDIQNVDGSWDYESEEEARDAFNRGVLSQGQLDDFILGQQERERKSQDLLKRYYANEFDLGSLHDQLLKVHGGKIKPAFEWLLKNARR